MVDKKIFKSNSKTTLILTQIIGITFLLIVSFVLKYYLGFTGNLPDGHPFKSLELKGFDVHLALQITFSTLLIINIWFINLMFTLDVKYSFIIFLSLFFLNLIKIGLNQVVISSIFSEILSFLTEIPVLLLTISGYFLTKTNNQKRN